MVGMGTDYRRITTEGEDAGLYRGGLAVSMGARWKIDPLFPPGKRSRQHLVCAARRQSSQKADRF